MISLKVPKGREFCTSQSSLFTVGRLYLFRKVPWEAETHFLSSTGFDFVFCTNPFLVYMAELQIFGKESYLI